MIAAESADPVGTSCHEGETGAELRPSGGPPASGDRTDAGEDPLEQIEGRWNLQILLCLNARGHRFSDLRAAIPRVSANVLTDRLRALECAGLIERHYLPPPHASQLYILAECAAGLRPVLDALARWRIDASRALDAVAIMDALGPLYCEEKKSARTRTGPSDRH